MNINQELFIPLTITRAETLYRTLLNAHQNIDSLENHNKLKYEFWPLIRLAKIKKAQQLKLINESSITDPKEQHDGELYLNSTEPLKIEFTTAINTEEEYKELHDHRENQEEYIIAHDNEQAYLSTLIKQAIDKKSLKQQKGSYQNTVLVIVVNDEQYDRTLLENSSTQILHYCHTHPNQFLELHILGLMNYHKQIIPALQSQSDL